MATYYNYVERSAESQINWAEVGKNMSDMLLNENRVREQKKSAIDAASREFGQILSNPPQGEHKGANQWALEYADNASKYMLMQDKLLKSGQLSLKDYTVARQNILDGTDQAFNLAKDYQTVFADKMERYKADKSQDLEQWLMAQAEGYSDFNKSQLYINPTDGTLSVAMKEKKVIDGKEVFVMNQNPNQFSSVSSLRNQIAGKYDKFNTNAATDAFIKGLGDEVTSAIAKTASLTSGGLIQNVEDIRNRKDIDPATKQILYKFSDSENQFIKSTLVNPYDRLSVLTNSKKFAPNGMQYGFTYDEKEAKGNPNKILLKVDPSSGQPTPQFSDEQIKVSEDFMRTELRAKYSRKEELRPTPQAQLQERRAPTAAEFERSDKSKEQQSVAGSWNQLYTGKTASEKKAAAEILLGTPRAQQLGLVDIDLETQPGKVLLKYVDNKMDRTIDLLDASKNPISLKDFSSKGVELHGVVDRDKAMKAGGGGTVFGRIADYKGIRASRRGVSSSFEPILVPLNAITSESSEAANALQSSLPSGFKVKDTGGLIGNTVELTAPNGKVYKYTSKKGAVSSEAIKKDLEAFIRANNVSTGGTGGGELD